MKFGLISLVISAFTFVLVVALLAVGFVFAAGIFLTLGITASYIFRFLQEAEDFSS